MKFLAGFVGKMDTLLSANGYLNFAKSSKIFKGMKIFDEI
jgi:hypothetical protein